MNSYIPQVGDFTSRVVNGTSLLYRVRSIEYGTYAALDLIDGPGGCNLTEHVCLTTIGWEWPDGAKVTFTSGSGTWQALAATRLTTLREVLRNKYFHYAAMAEQTPPEDTTADGIRDEYAEQLFLTETGLRYDQDVERFEEFYDTLHDEFLASKES